MAARYNCYFLAKEKMLEIDASIIKSYTDDYNYILPFFPPLDTNFTKGKKADLDFVFEKAKITFDKHKNSEWVAESYNIIGKAKWYQNRLDTAIYVHKYVLAKTSDQPGRQMAQISLMRIYVFQNEYNEADEEFKGLKKQKIYPENQKAYDEACIEYYYKQREFTKMLPHLESVLTLEKKKDRRARLNFIIGQISQRNGDQSTAYDHYKKSLKRNPPYEIEFNAKLNMSQVADINSKEQLKKMNKSYDKMIVDEKNKDYLGRIYYERAKFELKRNHLGKAVIYLNRSLEAPNTPKDQKAYAYLLLGQLHYEKIDSLPTKVDKYKGAKLYYDSTVASMNPSFEHGEDIKIRQKILAEFVEQLEIVEKEEKLQRWANLSEEELKIEVDKQMQIDKEKLERERSLELKREEQAKKADKTEAIDEISAPQLGKAVFFAYDQNAKAIQKQQFQDNWGFRPLEDNWRRSSKPIVEKIETKTEDLANTSPTDSASTIAGADSASTENTEIVLDQDEYTSAIPKNSADLEKSNVALEDALYQLGKIYYYNLEEIDNSQDVFERYVNKFRGKDHEAEVIYFLYLICQRNHKCAPDTYVKLERERYPHSLYRKLMENEDYLSDNEDENKASHLLYEQAFDLYKKEQYSAARALLAQNKATYPKSDILDKVVYLNILIYGKTDQVARYYTDLAIFVKDFGTSPLRHKANEILSFKPANLDLTLANDSSFKRNDDQEHYFLAIFKPNQMPFNEIDRIYKEFRANYYKDLVLSTKTIEFSDSTYLYVNKSFANFDVAKQYLDKLYSYHEFGGHLAKIEYSYYLVTEENYKKLIASKNIKEFEAFYKKQYEAKK